MRGTPVVAVATVAWLVAGVWGGRLIASSPPPTEAPVEVAPAPADVVVLVGLAETAAIAWARGGDTGTTQLRALPRRPDAALAARDADHYVDRAIVVDLDGADDDWVVGVRVDALRVTGDGYAPAAPVLVSVPVTRRDGVWLLAGQPQHHPADTASAATAG